MRSRVGGLIGGKSRFVRSAPLLLVGKVIGLKRPGRLLGRAVRGIDGAVRSLLRAPGGSGGRLMILRGLGLIRRSLRVVGGKLRLILRLLRRLRAELRRLCRGELPRLVGRGSFHHGSIFKLLCDPLLLSIRILDLIDQFDPLVCLRIGRWHAHRSGGEALSRHQQGRDRPARGDAADRLIDSFKQIHHLGTPYPICAGTQELFDKPRGCPSNGHTPRNCTEYRIP